MGSQPEVRSTQNLSGGTLQATLLLDHMPVYLKMGIRGYKNIYFGSKRYNV